MLLCQESDSDLFIFFAWLYKDFEYMQIQNESFKCITFTLLQSLYGMYDDYHGESGLLTVVNQNIKGFCWESSANAKKSSDVFFFFSFCWPPFE